MKYRGAALLILILLLALGQNQRTGAQATATFTNTPTATLDNTGLIAIATIPPPRACWSALVPCGPMPFSLPRFPTVALPSPTPWPTVPSATPIPITATPTYTFTPSETPTLTPTSTGTITPAPTATESPTPTFAGILDTRPLSTVGSGVSQIGSTLRAQTTQTVMINGTPVGLNEITQTFGQQIGTPFAFLRAIQESLGALGVVGTLINLLFLALMFMLFIKVSVVIMRFIIPVIRFVFEFFQTLKPL